MGAGLSTRADGGLSHPLLPELLAQSSDLRGVRRDQELFINRARSLTWIAVGTFLLAINFLANHLDLAPFLYLGYAVVCIAVWHPLLRRSDHPRFAPTVLIALDVLMLTLSGLSLAGPKGLPEGALSGLTLGLVLILATNALRLDWVPCAVGGVLGMGGMFLLRALFEPIGPFLMVNPVLIGLVVLALCVSIYRSRLFAEQLLDEVHRTQNQRTAVMGQLVAGVAHEMNTPLGAVSSGLSTLERAFSKRDEAPERTARAFAKALENARGGLSRIGNFLERLEPFAALDAAPREVLRLGPLVASVVKLQTGPGEGEIDMEVSNENEDVVLGNSAQLSMVFLNLVQNALEASPPSSRVTISFKSDRSRVCVSIMDNGPGVPAELISGVFTPNFSRSGHRVKLGLGLAVAQSILHEHQGSLSLLPGPEGGGTEARIELPRYGPRS